ncbi:MAG: hypothetical protein HQL86_07320 [Magnetococcales bacterium]|nr:hypothetical protein [Magnetococcales bacterium]
MKIENVFSAFLAFWMLCCLAALFLVAAGQWARLGPIEGVGFVFFSRLGIDLITGLFDTMIDNYCWTRSGGREW